MPDIQHANIPSEGCHEPKHFSTATTSDAGKVLTPSAATPGVSELRKLSTADITGYQQYIPAYAMMTSDGGTSKTLPSNEDDPTEINSLFTLSSGSGIEFSGNNLEFAVSGTYFVTILISNAGTADGTANVYYSINQGTSILVGSFSTDDNFATTFVLAVEEGDLVRLTANSTSASTVSFQPSNNISIYKVS